MAVFDVGSTSEFKDGTMTGKNFGGEQILVANVGGQFYAIGDVCTHIGVCNLSDGFLDGDNVECYCHGSVFNIKTGKVVRGPAINPELVYTTSLDGDRLLVDLAKAQGA